MGVPWLIIEDSWLRPSKQTKEQKEIETLNRELKTYKLQEPSFSLEVNECKDHKPKVSYIETRFIPLTSSEVAEAINQLKGLHPIRSNFEPPKPKSTKNILTGTITTTTYEKPSQDDIDAYQNEAHPNWLKRCEKIFFDLHKYPFEVRQPFLIKFEISNIGAKPAYSVRLEFNCKGSIRLKRISDSEELDSNENTEIVTKTIDQVRLPRPPEPPQFKKSIETQ